MIKIWELKLKILWLSLGFLICFSLIGCGKVDTTKEPIILNVSGFKLSYNWNISFQNLPIKNDDYEWTIALYQEKWNDTKFRDSLLIAEKYSRLGANAFAQENIDVLEDWWIKLSNLKKSQIRFNKKWEDINAVLVEYEITEWFIPEIPILYLSQLFVPNNNTMILMSFITEDFSSRDNVSKMFKNIN